MSAYNKALFGGIAGAVVAFYTWAVVISPGWPTLWPVVQALVIVVPSVLVGSAVVYGAPKNRDP